MQALLAAAVLAAGVAGCGFTSFVWWAYDRYIDDPQLIAIEQAKAASLAEASAARATRDEQLRQFRIGEAKFQEAYERELEDEAWRAARLQLLQAEIEDYARERQTAGTSCPLTRRDLDFLDGLQPPGAD